MEVNTVIFGRLPIIIFMRDFYDFPSMIGRLLWKKDCIEENVYGTMF